MNLYQLWKKGDYADGLRLLRQYAPGHLLLPLLRQGPSKMNRLYLTGALLKTPFRSIVAPEKKEEQPLTQQQDKFSLPQRIKELMHERAKLRNSYHEYGLRNDVPAIQARQRINRQLIDIRAEIFDVGRKMEYLQRVGELPAIPDEPTAPPSENVPATGLRELMNIRSSISRYKKWLAEAYEQNDTKQRIEKLELKLKQYETQRDLIEKQLKK